MPRALQMPLALHNVPADCCVLLQDSSIELLLIVNPLWKVGEKRKKGK